MIFMFSKLFDFDIVAVNVGTTKLWGSVVTGPLSLQVQPCYVFSSCVMFGFYFLFISYFNLSGLYVTHRERVTGPILL